jgi:hypothetical protein
MGKQVAIGAWLRLAQHFYVEMDKNAISAHKNIIPVPGIYPLNC